MDRTDSINVKAIAETIRLSNISGNGCNALSQDISNRLKQLINSSLVLMRSAKRCKLNVGDINRALKWLQHPVLYGHDTTEPVRMALLDDTGVYTTADRATSLLDVAYDESPFFLREGNRISSTWLTNQTLPPTVVDSEEPNVEAEVEENEFDDWDEMKLSGEQDVGAKNHVGKESDELLLPDDLIQYYHAVVKLVCLADDPDEEKGLSEVFNDLRSNQNISLLVTPFVRFFEEGLEEKKNGMFVMSLLHMMDALLSNPHLAVLDRGCGESIAATIIERVLNPAPSDPLCPMATHIHSKALHVLQRLLHAPARGPPMDETVVRARLIMCYEGVEQSNRCLSSVLSVYSCFSPTILLSDEYFTSFLTSHFLGFEEDWESALFEEKMWFGEAVGALKACYHVIYKHIVNDAAEEIIVGPRMKALSLDRFQSPSSCELLTEWLCFALELFGDGFLHLVLPLQLPREPVRIKPRIPKFRPSRVIRDGRQGRASGRKDLADVFEDLCPFKPRRPRKSAPEVQPVASSVKSSARNVIIVGKRRGTKFFSSALAQSSPSYGLCYYWL